MFELRWLLDKNFPRDIEHPPLEAYTLQYRYLSAGMDASGALNVMGGQWSHWIDVPYVDEKD